MGSKTPLLDNTDTVKKLRVLSEDKLTELADELRTKLIETVSLTGGHLGAGLGVVELTIALHYVFNTPEDILIWDVGHQSYPHKILTDRRDKILTLRQGNGISGFTKRDESPYDPFGAAHSSTSISAALGFSCVRDFEKQGHHVIAVIGDGAMSAGMAYEAMNNAGSMDKRLIVILNDNDMSIAPPVGAMSAYFSKLVSSHGYRSFRKFAKKIISKFGRPIKHTAKKWEEYVRGMASGGTLFEEMGFYYIGSIDGHDFEHLIPVLKNVKQMQAGPVLIHTVTKKGKGYLPAETADDKYHGVSKFNIITGKQEKPAVKTPSYTNIFANSLIELAEKDHKILAITAAMPSGTGLNLFAERFPDRMYDVGIAEQHAVTFGAGLAAAGYKPFIAIYSTFLQRAYDQVIHDVAIQKLPVRFAIDRAGLVGADGATHAGSFDIGYLGMLPGFVIMAAADEAELVHMVASSAAIDDRPSAFRYPRGASRGLELPKTPKLLEIGIGRMLTEGSRVAILSLGARLYEAKKAVNILKKMGISVSLADARFAKPLDTGLITQLARHHEMLITIEDGAIGGFGSFVMTYLSEQGFLESGLKVRMMTLPDYFIDQASVERQYDLARLNAEHIVLKILDGLGIDQKQIPKMA